MKKILAVLCAAALILGSAGASWAALDPTPTQAAKAAKKAEKEAKLKARKDEKDKAKQAKRDTRKKEGTADKKPGQASATFQ